ncbi:MAG TPA: hypothetical protein PKL31_02280 [Fulvivirga sp.]|nr:hypothetical protein [Fulvivirga sp.]
MREGSLQSEAALAKKKSRVSQQGISPEAAGNYPAFFVPKICCINYPIG